MNQQNGGSLGNQVYVMGVVLAIAYLLVAYFNFLVLVPKYLLQRNYVSYLVALSISMFLLLAVRFLQEYAVYSLSEIPHARVSYFNYVSLLDNISYFVVNTICIGGASMTVLLKEWIMENQRVSQLEDMRIQAEVEQLKDQVNPVFLFNILNKTGVLAKPEPERASQMVMKLSQLLRYQLYDSNRDKVLIGSEINFLTNYLMLEKLYSDSFDYEITTDGDLNRLMVPPLLFIFFAQYAVEQLRCLDDRPVVRFHFEGKNDSLRFTCYCINSQDTGFSRIRQRLDILYPDNYTLSVSKDKKTNMGEVKLLINL